MDTHVIGPCFLGETPPNNQLVARERREDERLAHPLPQVVLTLDWSGDA